MKPFFDKDVHFTASEEELCILRAATYSYAARLRQVEKELIDQMYVAQIEQLHKDITKILEGLPF